MRSPPSTLIRLFVLLLSTASCALAPAAWAQLGKPSYDNLPPSKVQDRSPIVHWSDAEKPGPKPRIADKSDKSAVGGGSICNINCHMCDKGCPKDRSEIRVNP